MGLLPGCRAAAVAGCTRDGRGCLAADTHAAAPRWACSGRGQRHDIYGSDHAAAEPAGGGALPSPRHAGTVPPRQAGRLGAGLPACHSAGLVSGAAPALPARLLTVRPAPLLHTVCSTQNTCTAGCLGSTAPSACGRTVGGGRWSRSRASLPRQAPAACCRCPQATLSAPAADYCFGDRKFGGNAQAITKDRSALVLLSIPTGTCVPRILCEAVCDEAPACAPACRWVHHTSLLWDFRDERMALLRQPAKQPEYRQASTWGVASGMRAGAVLATPGLPESMLHPLCLSHLQPCPLSHGPVHLPLHPPPGPRPPRLCGAPVPPSAMHPRRPSGAAVRRAGPGWLPCGAGNSGRGGPRPGGRQAVRHPPAGRAPAAAGGGAAAAAAAGTSGGRRGGRRRVTLTKGSQRIPCNYPVDCLPQQLTVKLPAAHLLRGSSGGTAPRKSGGNPCVRWAHRPSS